MKCFVSKTTIMVFRFLKETLGWLFAVGKGKVFTVISGDNLNLNKQKDRTLFSTDNTPITGNVENVTLYN